MKTEREPVEAGVRRWKGTGSPNSLTGQDCLLCEREMNFYLRFLLDWHRLSYNYEILGFFLREKALGSFQMNNMTYALRRSF